VLLPNSKHRGISKRIQDREEKNRLRGIVRRLKLPRGMGLICRTAAVGLHEDAIRTDVQLLLDKISYADELRRTQTAPVCIYEEPDVVERTMRDLLGEEIDEITVDSKDTYDLMLDYVKKLDSKDRTKVTLYDKPKPIFQQLGLTAQIKGIFQRKVRMASGAELCIDETEALVAIDINSGKSRKGKDHPETILNTNLEAASEVARQLRLRNIGGLVVVDFIDMRSRKDQEKVYNCMRDAVARDRAKTRIMRISKLGLMEMTRQREHESLRDSMFENCHYCNGKGLVKSSLSVSVEIQRRLQEMLRRRRGATSIRVTVHPDVMHRLRHEDAAILDAMENEFGGDLTFRADEHLHREEVRFADPNTGKLL
jgi:ribonuclease G